MVAETIAFTEPALPPETETNAETVEMTEAAGAETPEALAHLANIENCLQVIVGFLVVFTVIILLRYIYRFLDIFF